MYSRFYVVLICTLAGLASALTSQAQSALDADAGKQPTRACFISLHTTPTALQACRIALQASVASSLERAQLHSALAMGLLRQDQLIPARIEMDAALAITDLDPVIQANLGNLLIREGNYRGAIVAFNNALTATTDTPTGTLHSAVVYLNRSLALRALGRYDEASKDYAAYLVLFGLNSADEGQMGPLKPRLEPYIEPST